MTTIKIEGGEIITPFEQRVEDLWIVDGRISHIGDQKLGKADYVIDASQCYVTPGLFDLQVNGNANLNLWTASDPQAVAHLQHDLARAGTTCFLPTLITDEIEHLKKSIAFLTTCGAGKIWQALKGSSTNLNSIMETKLPLARMPGLHLEGPFISDQRFGAHKLEYVRKLTANEMLFLLTPAVTLVTLASEGDPSCAVLGLLKQQGVVVSLGHSNATYEEAQCAFEAGVTLMTHTFNALPPIHHRAPGPVTAAMLNSKVFCCVICDGHHVDPAIAKLLIKVKSPDKTILVSDAAQIGTSQGGLVGSSITLADAVRNLVAWHACTFAQAITMATYNPAAAVNMDGLIGVIEKGRLADIVIWRKSDLAIKNVLVGGVAV